MADEVAAFIDAACAKQGASRTTLTHLACDGKIKAGKAPVSLQQTALPERTTSEKERRRGWPGWRACPR